MIQETQRTAYNELKDASSKRELVFRAIDSYGGLTLFELVKILNWPVNRLTGRVNELVKLNRIQDSGKTRTNPESKKRGILWIVK
jgi:predicted transcriptional regulator